MRTLYLGDIHGNFNLINNYVKLYEIKNANIIQLGDFGVGFMRLDKELRMLQQLNDNLIKNNVFVWALRGNHDYKKYFDNDPFNLSNIKLIPDYTVINFENVNVLFIGGAVSVDRKYRYTKYQKNGDFTIRGNETWWEDERFIFDLDKIKNLRNIDIIVTHTCPDYCTPDNNNGFGYFVENIIKDTHDYELRNDLLKERKDVTNAFYNLYKNNNIKLHLYGHYHKSDVMNIDGVNHRLLNVGELWENYEK